MLLVRPELEARTGAWLALSFLYVSGATGGWGRAAPETGKGGLRKALFIPFDAKCNIQIIKEEDQ